jgi:hypothetical protein
VRSRLAPIKEVAGMLKRRFANIITYLKHRITKLRERRLAEYTYAETHELEELAADAFEVGGAITEMCQYLLSFQFSKGFRSRFPCCQKRLRMVS